MFLLLQHISPRQSTVTPRNNIVKLKIINSPIIDSSSSIPHISIPRISIPTHSILRAGVITIFVAVLLGTVTHHLHLIVRLTVEVILQLLMATHHPLHHGRLNLSMSAGIPSNSSSVDTRSAACPPYLLPVHVVHVVRTDPEWSPPVHVVEESLRDLLNTRLHLVHQVVPTSWMRCTPPPEHHQNHVKHHLMTSKYPAMMKSAIVWWRHTMWKSFVRHLVYR